MDVGAWQATVHGVAESDMTEQLTYLHIHILAWRIPWTGEPGGVQSMGSQRVKHN